MSHPYAQELYLGCASLKQRKQCSSGKETAKGEDGTRLEVRDIRGLDVKVRERQDLTNSRIPEDAAPGTVVALIGVTDLDSGVNGQVVCSLSDFLPFDLKPSPDGQSYSLITKDYLDKEITHMYNIKITAKDLGSPSLSSAKLIQPLMQMEEKMRQFHIFLTFHVVATDSGTPSLSSNVTVNVFILDQNDNAPVILYPLSSNGSAEGVEEIPRNVNAGHLVIKVRAYDADIGYNGWLLFSLQEVTDHSLFGLDRYTGQIRTLRSFTETDEVEHKLVILVKDNGNVSLSATATVIVKLVEPKDTFVASDVKSAAQEDQEHNVTFYLMITLGAVSVLFIISIIVLIAMQCSKSTDYTSKYLQETNYDGTLCHSIQYRSGDKRYMLVGPRMSIGSHGNTLVLPDRRTLNAADSDEGLNGEIEYTFGKTQKKKVYDIFELDNINGEIRVKGKVDFEETEIYRLDLQASDKGQPPLTGESRVVIKLKDLNDNKPEIEITSLSSQIPEDSKPGTVVSLISVTDRDSGLNGKVICSLSDNVSFDLKPSFQDNMYSLVLKQHLDRESVSHYDIIITATDCGQPPLSTFKTLSIDVSDINDSAPQFAKNPLELYLTENNVPGNSIFSVSASDKDLDENAAISYHLVRREGSQSKIIAFLNVNSENGEISALKSFDFETLKTFQFHVVATDSGTPSLSSNVTVNVFILDQNDNAPVILYPLSSNGSAEGVEEIPRNVNAGHLVTKVRAYDADIGYNGWLLFSLQEVTDHSLFGLDRYTGQIRTLRSFTETDEAEHKLVILVKDNGNVSLSATATVIIKLVEPKEAFAASDIKSAVNDDEDNNVTFYLMITIGGVSVLFIISIIVLIAMQCSKSTDYTSKYLQETNYDGTLCHSIQYRSGDKRYMLVGPRMSIGSAIVPGSHANTLKLPDRRITSEEVGHLNQLIIM
ncbi:protocadherin alpha-3-like [Anableps anableps]